MAIRSFPGLPLFILGAAKCGTNHLHNYCCRHPQICASSPKETYFFEYFYDKDIDFFLNKFFPHYSNEPVLSEGRPLNLILPFVPMRILGMFPDSRFIVSLRDPVSRAFSHWWMKRCLGHENLSFEDAIAENLNRLQNGPSLEGKEGADYWKSKVRTGNWTVDIRVYIDCGFYAEQLKRYFKFFPRDRFLIITTSELRNNQARVFKSLCELVDIDPSLGPETFDPSNTAPTPVMIPILWLDRRLHFTRWFPENFVARVRNQFTEIGSPPIINPDTGKRLRELYKPHNMELARLLGWTHCPWDPSPEDDK